MIKKIAILLTVMVLSTAIFADEIELGISFTPGSVLLADDTQAFMEEVGGEYDQNLLGFHFGYSFMWLLYASIDSMIVPPWYVYQTTSYIDADGFVNGGIDAPGYVSFYNFGIRPKIGPVYALATVGLNDLYIHSDYPQLKDTSLGVNFRLGFGVEFDGLAINFVGTSAYATFDQLSSKVNRAFVQQETGAIEDIMATIIPSIGFELHF